MLKAFHAHNCADYAPTKADVVVFDRQPAGMSALSSLTRYRWAQVIDEMISAGLCRNVHPRGGRYALRLTAQGRKALVECGEML